MPTYSRTAGNVVRFPAAQRAEAKKVPPVDPYTDDGLEIPPFDCLNPFGSRALNAPPSTRAKGAAPLSLPRVVSGPRLFRDVLETALFCLKAALLALSLYALLFAVFAVTPQ